MATLTDKQSKLRPVSPRPAASLSAGERMARFAALQPQAFALLALSPEGQRRFWERNLRQRRIHGSF